MANPVIYMPLLKKGFQEIPDVGTIQAELADLQERLTAAQNAINALQGNKVTKITDSSQLSAIEENEIFQWQTDDATIDGTSFKNGYFYKCTTNSITLPTGTQYFENGIDEVNLYGYDVRPGNFYVVEDNTPASSNDFFNLRVMTYNSNPDYLFVNYAFPTVGEAVWNRATNEVVTVQSVDENLSLHLSDGQTVTTTNAGSSHPYKLYKVLDENGNYFNVANCSPMGVWIFMPNYVVNGNSFTVNDWFCIRYYNLLTTMEPTEIGQNTFAQTDTQPRLTGISNDEGGGVAISTDVTIAGNLTVQGTQTVVQTQEIDSETDNINLRYNNPLGLADGDESGVKVLNYDGNNTNCFLGVDNKGWARVGDEGGTLQKLATIEETPTDGEFVKYNTTTKQLESGTIPTPAEATTTTAGLMSAADKAKLDGLSVSNVTTYTKSNSTFKFYKYGRIVNVFIILNVTGSAPIPLTIDAAFAPLENVYGYGVPFMSSGNCSIEITGTTLNFIGKGGICLSYLAAS